MDKKPKRTNRVPNVTFYLGKDERSERVKRLDELAAELGYADRSKLLQAIADRRVKVTRQPQAS
jgi:hypothetical protein